MYIADSVIAQMRQISVPGYWIALGEEGGIKRLVDVTDRTSSTRISYYPNQFIELAKGNDFIGILRAVSEDAVARSGYDTTMANFGLRMSEERSRGDHELWYTRLDVREPKKVAGWLCLPHMIPVPAHPTQLRWTGGVQFEEKPLETDKINELLAASNGQAPIENTVEA
jgi:hypothetical protein